MASCQWRRAVRSACSRATFDPGETFVTCPNQDVVYGLVFFSLDEEPVVAQVPNFSMTLYNEEHFFHPTSQKRYSLGTKNKNLQKAPTVR